jgi:hypothetical protein
MVLSWVSRRLALVELLPEAVQRHVREGSITAQIAMKYLVPVARVSAEDCERMAEAFVKHRCDTRQAAQLYNAWREGSRVVRERILTEPELFLKTQKQPQAKPAAAEQIERDLEMALAILRRAGRRLSEALPEMNTVQQEQAQRGIESARRELNRMTERIGKEKEARHAEPGATNSDSGTAREGSEPTRDLAHAAGIARDHKSIKQPARLQKLREERQQPQSAHRAVRYPPDLHLARKCVQTLRFARQPESGFSRVTRRVSLQQSIFFGHPQQSQLLPPLAPPLTAVFRFMKMGICLTQVSPLAAGR